MTEEPSKRTHITFDEDGNPNIDETISTSVYMPADMVSAHLISRRLTMDLHKNKNIQDIKSMSI